MNPTGWPLHSEDELSAVQKVLISGRTNYWTGTECREFEKEFAQFAGTSYAVALMNGSIALEAALASLNIGPGDEVITTCRTFVASASCIIMRGAVPIFADVDLHSQNITADTIKPCITSKTKAIIVVHLAGWPADMVSILALANQHNLKVIEDCAQAHGALIDGRPVGSWGDVAAFSFCQDKIISTGGEGGMVTTNDASTWQKIWSLKDHGKNYQKVFNVEHPPGFRWLHDSFGTNWRMTEMQAAIGRVQLKKLPEWIRLRQQNAKLLIEKLNDLGVVDIPLPGKRFQHVFYRFYLFIRPELLKPDWSRDRIIQTMNEQGLACFSGSCSEVYLESSFKQAQLCPEQKPNAKRLGETSIALLVHPTLTRTELEKTANTLKDILLLATV